MDVYFTKMVKVRPIILRVKITVIFVISVTWSLDRMIKSYNRKTQLHRGIAQMDNRH